MNYIMIFLRLYMNYVMLFILLFIAFWVGFSSGMQLERDVNRQFFEQLDQLQRQHDEFFDEETKDDINQLKLLCPSDNERPQA